MKAGPNWICRDVWSEPTWADFAHTEDEILIRRDNRFLGTAADAQHDNDQQEAAFLHDSPKDTEGPSRQWPILHPNSSTSVRALR
jgi:hypothetical protein